MDLEDEKAKLEYKKCEAKFKCRESWKTLKQLGKMTKTYLKDWEKWSSRAEKADRELAEIDGRLRKFDESGNEKGKVRQMKSPPLTAEQVDAVMDAIAQLKEGGDD